MSNVFTEIDGLYQRRYAAFHSLMSAAMSNSEDSEEQYHSPQDMRSWLRQELRDVAKASELRVREATELVNAYALGEITPREATERQWAYERRWGEALPGVCATDSVTDVQILDAIDKSRMKFSRSSSSEKGRGPGRSL